MMYYTLGDDDYITGQYVIDLIVDKVDAVSLFEKIYLIKTVIMRPGCTCFRYTLAHSVMKIVAFIGVKFDVIHSLPPLSFPIVAFHIKKVKKNS